MKRLALPVFVAATFLAAFVLFAMQPFAGRALLPQYGGAPHVWVTTAVFFQVAVLLGYSYAHAAPKRLSPAPLAGLHVALAIVAFIAFRPNGLVGAAALGKLLAGAPPGVRLLCHLAVTVGIPAFFLSSTSPLVQLFVTRTKTISNPYYLYVASNGGSLLALVAYPAVVEPNIGLATQSAWLRAALAAAVACVAASAWLGRLRPPDGAPDAPSPAPTEARASGATGEAAEGSPAAPDAATQWRWFLLAFGPSLLLSGMTLHVTTDVVAIPLFWVVPLGIYLVSFMVAFGRYGQRISGPVRRMALLFGTFLICAMHANVASLWAILPHALYLLLAATACHSILATLRPHPVHLTRFYFVMSLGGAAGGAFCSIVAPLLFRDLTEYPIAIVLVAWLLVDGTDRLRPWFLAIPLLTGALTYGLSQVSQRCALTGSTAAALVFGPVILLAHGFSKYKNRYALAVAGIFVASTLFLRGDLAYRNRNFFGVLRVVREGNGRFLSIVNGTTTHGIEDVRAPGTALSYYHPTGPAGDFFGILNQQPPGHRVFIIGLGIGTLGAYAAPEDRWTFFELNDLDVYLAKDAGYFHALSSMRAPYEIVVGDARLELEHRTAAAGDADVVVVDAFSSDMIPIHLLTVEAVKLYDFHARWAILFHLSNQFADLAPVTAAAASAVGMSSLVRTDLELSPADVGKRASRWLVATRDPQLLRALAQRNPDWVTPAPTRAPWTDDKADVLSALSAKTPH
ncbi:MAG: hypothetical protein HOO96_06595 [Polyangiaceae bacterium]|nr:hypothetical protein [Polyangiaceae bacterium]